MKEEKGGHDDLPDHPDYYVLDNLSDFDQDSHECFQYGLEDDGDTWAHRYQETEDGEGPYHIYEGEHAKHTTHNTLLVDSFVDSLSDGQGFGQTHIRTAGQLAQVLET